MLRFVQDVYLLETMVDHLKYSVVTIALTTKIPIFLFLWEFCDFNFLFLWRFCENNFREGELTTDAAI